MAVIRVARTPGGDYTVRLRSQDSDLFHELIEELKACVPYRWRQYDPDDRCWRVSSRGHLDIWLDYVEDLADVRIIWDSEESEYGARQQAPPPPPRRPGRMIRADAFAALHLLPSAPAPLVKVAYRELAKIYHTDRGGDLEAMKRVNVAFELLQKEGAA